MLRRRIPAFLLVFALLPLTASPVLADDFGTNATQPVAGEGPSSEIIITEDAYRGPTRVTHPADADVCRGPSVCSDSFSLTPHTHVVEAITGTYDGYYDYSTGRGCVGPCTLSASESQSWSNTYGVSIQFDKGPISAKVGYDVTYSSTLSFTYSFYVPSGVTKVVRYKDWYHVTNMNVRTDWYLGCTTWCIISPEYGTAWAGKWYQRIFYAQTV